MSLVPTRPPRRSRESRAALGAHARDRRAAQAAVSRCALRARLRAIRTSSLVATILSAQCTDVRVNMVTPALFARWPDAQRWHGPGPTNSKASSAPPVSSGTRRSNLIGMAQGVVADHGGEIPATMARIRPLPGVGRKTANVILGNAYGVSEGITVDTHVLRLGGCSASRTGPIRKAWSRS